MGKQRMVDTRFWEDVWIVERLNPLDRYLMLYLLTNSKTNIAGVYEISLRTIAFETGIESESVAKMIERLSPRVHYIDNWIILQNAIKHQNYKNSKIKAGIEFCLAQAPSELLKWVDLPDEISISHDDSSMTHKDSSHLNININQNKDLNKNIINTTNVVLADKAAAVHGKPEINELLQYWEEVVGYPITSKLKLNRYAVSNLLKRMTTDEIKSIINTVALAHEDKFSGNKYNDFVGVQSNLNSLLSWDKRRNSTSSGTIGVVT